MKLIVRQYLHSLKERNELDAILPDLISELGFEVISTPMRGTSQAGVDVAAVGPDWDDGDKRKLFLFTIKAGDLTRKDWNGGSPQDVRPSLEQILDSYIPHRIPEQFRSLPIAICVCMGGSWAENVRDEWAGFTKRQSTKKICFREWNGDKLAELLLKGVLRSELLEDDRRSDFQKAVAMLDAPDISYRFFRKLLYGLLESNSPKPSDQLARLRQIYICLWILFVWARDEDNFEAPYRCSELAILLAWNICRANSNKKGKIRDFQLNALDQLIKLHLIISENFISEKITPFAKSYYAISSAVNSRSAIDVNIAVTEQFGRICLDGLWYHWWYDFTNDEELKTILKEKRDKIFSQSIQIINNNKTIMSPICDEFAIEISLFILLAQACSGLGRAQGFIAQTTERCIFTINTRNRYPTPTLDYHELVGHPKDRSDEYFEESTRASALYPVLMFWLSVLDLEEMRSNLAQVLDEKLSHTTQQLWVPDEDTDELIWVGNTYTGKAVTGLPITGTKDEYLSILNRICADHQSFIKLSTTISGLWPIFLTACRHYRLPVPPHFWTPFIQQANED